MNEKQLAKHWWSIFIRGIIAIAFGVMMFFATGFTLKLFLIFLGTFLLLNGLFSMIGAYIAAKDHQSYGGILLGGIISVAVSIFVFAYPQDTIKILAYIIAIWAMVAGIIDLYVCFKVAWAAGIKIFIGITGVLSIILGIIFFAHPTFSLEVIIWMIGIYTLLIGLSLIVYSFKLRPTD